MVDLPSHISQSIGTKPDVPEGVEVGDFLVARFAASEWSRFFPWENWDHAALVTRMEPLTIIEATGIILQRADKKSGREEAREGVVENAFLESRTVLNADGSTNPEGNLWLQDGLREVLWLKPVFPRPLRATDHWSVRWKKRKVITEAEARQRVVAYARSQVGDPFRLSIFSNTKVFAKSGEKAWYCSLLVFKAYSRTVTNMYLESYEPYSGLFVTPEDLVQSKRSSAYHHWLCK